MDGIFFRKQFNISLFLLFGSSAFFIGFYVYLNIVNGQSTEQLSFLLLGILLLLAAIYIWKWNFKAYIHVDEDTIRAKYNLFGKIDCKLSDVTFVLGRSNSLIIQVKDKKNHTIMGLLNSLELSSFIRQKTSYKIEESYEALLDKLVRTKHKKKKGTIYVVVGLLLSFINIFVTVLLTGGRELYEFTRSDWLIFTMMGIVEAATYFIIFYIANKTGQCGIYIEKLQYTIQRKAIETTALLPGYHIAVYTDYNYSHRITLFGYPNDNAVYYSVEKFVLGCPLLRTFTSSVLDSQKELPDIFETLIDITDNIFINQTGLSHLGITE